MAGKAQRKGISLVEAVQKFSDEAAAEAWFVERRWPDGIRCPYCECDKVSPRKNGRKTPAYRCNPCKRDFTVKTGTIMHDSKLPLSKWALAFYLMSTSIKGVSSMKLHRDLGISQKSAWHLAHRIRETWDDQTGQFTGPVEADETYMGGREGNKHESRKLHAGRGPVGKTPVAGVKDRATGKVSAAVVPATDKPTIQRFVRERVTPDAVVYTDEHGAYQGLPNRQAVSHGAREFVRGMAHTNGVESFWALMKRGYIGTYHHMSRKHLPRYVSEFAGRHNQRPLDTADQLDCMARGAIGKRLPWRKLVAGPPC